MPLPFIVGSAAEGIGRTPQQVAEQFVRNMYWLCRWSDEIINDPDLDLKKLIQLVHAHCRLIANMPDTVPDDICKAISARLQQEGFDWSPEPTELNQLKAACVNLATFVRDNLPPEYREFAKRTMGSDGVEVEEPVKISPKPAAIMSRVNALRAHFH